MTSVGNFEKKRGGRNALKIQSQHLKYIGHLEGPQIDGSLTLKESDPSTL